MLVSFLIWVMKVSMKCWVGCVGQGIWWPSHTGGDFKPQPMLTSKRKSNHSLHQKPGNTEYLFLNTFFCRRQKSWLGCSNGRFLQALPHGAIGKCTWWIPLASVTNWEDKSILLEWFRFPKVLQSIPAELIRVQLTGSHYCQSHQLAWISQGGKSKKNALKMNKSIFHDLCKLIFPKEGPILSIVTSLWCSCMAWLACGSPSKREEAFQELSVSISETKSILDTDEIRAHTASGYRHI